MLGIFTATSFVFAWRVDMKFKHKPATEVYCHDCKDWKDTEKVRFVNIEESFLYGEDIMTFDCPTCKTQQKSLVRKRG